MNFLAPYTVIGQAWCSCDQGQRGKYKKNAPKGMDEQFMGMFRQRTVENILNADQDGIRLNVGMDIMG